MGGWVEAIAGVDQPDRRPPPEDLAANSALSSSGDEEEEENEEEEDKSSDDEHEAEARVRRRESEAAPPVVEPESDGEEEGAEAEKAEDELPEFDEDDSGPRDARKHSDQDGGHDGAVDEEELARLAAEEAAADRLRAEIDDFRRRSALSDG